MNTLYLCLFAVYFTTMLSKSRAWDNDELEVFDVVEEVNQNFYTMLSVPQDADQAAIKKAFRKLSLVLHPDKNDAPDAEIQFRQLVSVYDILKDPNKRRCYDEVLTNGLPDWKHAVYYYRRVRKMGLAEMTVILFIIVSISQYLIGWGSYIERKYTMEEFVNNKTKRLLKKQKKGKADAITNLPPELEIEIEKPSVKNTLPFQIPQLIWFIFVTCPPLMYHWVKDYWHERQLRKQQEAEEQEESEEEQEVSRGPRRRKPAFVLPEVKDDGEVDNSNRREKKRPPKPSAPPVISGGLWTDDDLADLARLVKKYPVGTTERWEKIGEAMNRPAAEVAHMAHKLKDSVLKNLAQKAANGDVSESNEMMTVVEEPRKVKTRGGKHGDATENNVQSWNQVQQKALESALAKFPKGSSNDRWEKIAKCVPGKTKEECMLRYKQLVDLVKKKKEKEEAESTNDTQKQESEEKTETSDINSDSQKEIDISDKQTDIEEGQT